MKNIIAGILIFLAVCVAVLSPEPISGSAILLTIFLFITGLVLLILTGINHNQPQKAKPEKEKEEETSISTLGATLIIIIVCIVIYVILMQISSSTHKQTNIHNSVLSPTPTSRPNPTWHTVYTFSGGNGETQTDDFTLNGKKWKLDYQTYNDGGSLFLTGYENGNIGNIMVDGISNNSMPGYNACFPDSCSYSVSVDSIDQNYSLKVEDYY